MTLIVTGAVVGPAAGVQIDNDALASQNYTINTTDSIITTTGNGVFAVPPTGIN
jgi:hypothetical protein